MSKRPRSSLELDERGACSQLLLANNALRRCLGFKFCNEADLLTLLLSHRLVLRSEGSNRLTIVNSQLRKAMRLGRNKDGCDEADLMQRLLKRDVIRRVQTITVHVDTIGGISFTLQLDTQAATVLELTREIELKQGIKPFCQELYRVQKNADGSAVREFDADPELLDVEAMLIDQETVQLAVFDYVFRVIPSSEKGKDTILASVADARSDNSWRHQMGTGYTCELTDGHCRKSWSSFSVRKSPPPFDGRGCDYCLAKFPEESAPPAHDPMAAMLDGHMALIMLEGEPLSDDDDGDDEVVRGPGVLVNMAGAELPPRPVAALA